MLPSSSRGFGTLVKCCVCCVRSELKERFGSTKASQLATMGQGMPMTGKVVPWEKSLKGGGTRGSDTTVRVEPMKSPLMGHISLAKNSR